MTYNPDWRTEDEQRIQTLDRLYFIDLRHLKGHPQHSTYTGLWDKYKGQDIDEAV